VLSKILLVLGLVLLALKFGLHTRLGLIARLRQLGRVVDRFVNIALVVIVVGYVVQLAYLYMTRR
jgi:hypothetical protein